MTLDELRAQWAARRDDLGRLRAHVDGAAIIERFLADLDECERATADEPLSLQRAASMSGYSAEHLARLVRQGRIPNAGRPHKPLIRAGDLPRKVANSLDKSSTEQYDPAADARALLSRRGGR